MRKLLAALLLLTGLLAAQTTVVGGAGGGGTGPQGPAGATGATGATGNPGPYTATFLLCAAPCAANETSNWKWTAERIVTVSKCLVDAKTYPTGSGSLTVDVLKNGTTSIFSSTVPTLAPGGTVYNSQSGMSAAAVLAVGDYLSATVLTITGTLPGQLVNVVCSVTP